MGIASLTHQGKVLRFRTNPNSITWEYNLKTNIEETYGGQVVQVLSANIDNLRVTADSGNGGWAYLESVALFMRDMLFDQREGLSQPGIFRYPPRGWEMKVFALNFPFKDSVNDVLKPFTMNFKVQEDVSGVVTSSLIEAEMEKYSKGIGWERNEYNTPSVEWVDGEYKPLDTHPAYAEDGDEDNDNLDDNMIVDPNDPNMNNGIPPGQGPISLLPGGQ